MIYDDKIKLYATVSSLPSIGIIQHVKNVYVFVVKQRIFRGKQSLHIGCCCFVSIAQCTYVQYIRQTIHYTENMGIICFSHKT